MCTVPLCLTLNSLIPAAAAVAFLQAVVSSPGGFQAVRLFIGMSLCTFVCCQFWVGSMFSVNIVGTANAITAGWGNMGGGATQLIMPLIYGGIVKYVPASQAWRWAFFVPGGCYILVGIVVLFFSQVGCRATAVATAMHDACPPLCLASTLPMPPLSHLVHSVAAGLWTGCACSMLLTCCVACCCRTRLWVTSAP